MQDDTLDLVSARFADLVAQDHYSKYLDGLAHQLFSCHDEPHLAARLLRTLAQRCSVNQAIYLAPEEHGDYQVVDSLGFPPELADTPSLRLRLPEHAPFVLSTEEWPDWEHSLLSHLPIRSVLCLRWEHQAPSLILLDRQPGHHILRNFLQRLAERASQALFTIRLRESLQHLRQEHHQQKKDIQQQNRMLSLMEDWNGVLTMLEDRVTQLDELLANAVTSLDADKGSLMLFDEPSGDLIVRAVHGIEAEVADRIRRGEEPCKKLRLGEGVAGKVAQTLQPMIVNQVEREPLFLEPKLSRVSSILCLPLHVDGLVLGVLNLTNRTPGKRFQTTHVEDGMKLAAQASQAINNSRLYHLAVLDPVTQVYTRAHLYHRIQDETSRARRYQRHVSLLVVGLQGLTPLRDRARHGLANQLEAEVAMILRRETREMDVVGRLGEASLAVLLPETDGLGAIFLSERIQQETRKSELLSAHSLTTHIGICSFPDRADSVLKMVARAESAMHSAWRYPNEISVYVTPAGDLEPESLNWAAS